MKKIGFIIELVLTIAIMIIAVVAYTDYKHDKIVDPLFKDSNPTSEYIESICGVYSNGSYHLYIDYMNDKYNVELTNDNDTIVENYVNINTSGENIYYVPLVDDEKADCPFINIDMYDDGNIRVYVWYGDDDNMEYYYLSKDNNQTVAENSATLDENSESVLIGMCNVYPYIEVI